MGGLYIATVAGCESLQHFCAAFREWLHASFSDGAIAGSHIPLRCSCMGCECLSVTLRTLHICAFHRPRSRHKRSRLDVCGSLAHDETYRRTLMDSRRGMATPPGMSKF